MSSYRPPFRRNVWPDREAEKREAARRAEEEQRRRMEMNDTNFPTLSTARPANQASGNEFAKLAEKWAVDADMDRRVEEYKKFQEAADRAETERIPTRRSQHSRFERHDTQYEQDVAPSYSPVQSSGFENDSGWTEVKRKTRKPKKVMSVEEMDQQVESQERERQSEFNAHLFDSNRHDHDRV